MDARFINKFVLLNLIFLNFSALLTMEPARGRASDSDMDIGYESVTSAVPLRRSARVAAGASAAELCEEAHYRIQESRRAIPRGRRVPDVRIYISDSCNPQETVGCEFSVSQFTGNPKHLYTAYARFVRRAQQLQNLADAAAPGRFSPLAEDAMMLLSTLPAPVYRAASPAVSDSVGAVAVGAPPVLARTFSTATTVRPPSPDRLEDLPADLTELFDDSAARAVSRRRRNAEISTAIGVKRTKAASVKHRSRPAIEDELCDSKFKDYSSGDDDHRPKLSS
jgi:hypothetical protein